MERDNRLFNLMDLPIYHDYVWKKNPSTTLCIITIIIIIYQSPK